MKYGTAGYTSNGYLVCSLVLFNFILTWIDIHTHHHHRTKRPEYKLARQNACSSYYLESEI